MASDHRHVIAVADPAELALASRREMLFETADADRRAAMPEHFRGR
ncbi:MAG: hypothetical protein Q7J60_15575 [Bradyrhizobium sp.]|nr:hypothetical protein [Bradyrhizobium sp.]